MTYVIRPLRPDLLVLVTEAATGNDAHVLAVDPTATTPTYLDVGAIGDTAAALPPLECAGDVCGVAAPGTGLFHPIVADGTSASGLRVGTGVDVGGLPLGCSTLATSTGATFFCTSQIDATVTRIDVTTAGATTSSEVALTGCTGPIGVAALSTSLAMVACDDEDKVTTASF